MAVIISDNIFKVGNEVKQSRSEICAGQDLVHIIIHYIKGIRERL